MDRCALFVDAGYFLAAGGLVCCGTKRRADIECDYEGTANGLADLATRDSGLTVLRAYWYDGAPDGIPLPDHVRIAHLTNVKLRLGRLSGGEQKGVDSLIVRDLMTLARERAIATAYVLSGDEDLREGVVAAQDMGVRVVLFGIPPLSGGNQAATLVREADEHIVLTEDFLKSYISKPTARQRAELGASTVEAAAEVGVEFGTAWA